MKKLLFLLSLSFITPTFSLNSGQIKNKIQRLKKTLIPLGGILSIYGTIKYFSLGLLIKDFSFLQTQGGRLHSAKKYIYQQLFPKKTLIKKPTSPKLSLLARLYVFKKGVASLLAFSYLAHRKIKELEKEEKSLLFKKKKLKQK